MNPMREAAQDVVRTIVDDPDKPSVSHTSDSSSTTSTIKFRVLDAPERYNDSTLKSDPAFDRPDPSAPTIGVFNAGRRVNFVPMQGGKPTKQKKTNNKIARRMLRQSRWRGKVGTQVNNAWAQRKLVADETENSHEAQRVLEAERETMRNGKKFGE